MKKSTKRAISLAISLPIIGLGVFGMLTFMGMKEPPAKRSSKQGVRKAMVMPVQSEDVLVEVNLEGRLIPVQRVPLFAEVTGRFESSAHPFRIGAYYKKGEILAHIDNKEASYNLLAQKSSFANLLAQAMPELKIDHAETFPAWESYLRNFDPKQTMPELPKVQSTAAQYFLNGKNIFSQFYSIKAVEERLSKYTLRAPVSGTLTEVNATVGALIRQGQPLATLTAKNYELAATVSVADLKYLKRGTTAKLFGPNQEEYQARISRISNQIDPNTQSATVFLTVSGTGLKEGLYLQGKAKGEALENIVVLDQKLIQGDQEVYVVVDSTLEIQKVNIVRRGMNTIFVNGISEGQILLAEPIPGAYRGMQVSPVSAK